jgi:hypothetical protein
LILLDCELDFQFAVFRHSETKSGSFNVVHSLDHPTQSTIYGALAQTAGLLGYDYDMLDKVHLTTPVPTKPPSRVLLINTAPLSPLDWQPKGVLEDYTYDSLVRIYPRKIAALDHPRYKLHVLLEDDESEEFLFHSFRLLARNIGLKKGLGLGIGYKKKFLSAFDAKIQALGEVKPCRKMRGGTIATLLAPCPAGHGDILLNKGAVMSIPYRNIHCTRETEIARVYPERSEVIVKHTAPIVWYELREWLGDFALESMDLELSDLTSARKIALGISKEIRLNRKIGGHLAKAFEPIFLARIDKRRSQE